MGTAEHGRSVQDDPLAQHFRRGSTARGSGAGIECAARGEIVTTKDHAKLAAALSAAFQTATTTGQAHGVRLAANSIVLVLEKDNPKFDRNKFEKALGFSLAIIRSEEHTSELQSRLHLVCRLLLEKKKETSINSMSTV